MHCFTLTLTAIQPGITLSGLGPADDGPVCLALGAGSRRGQARRIPTRVVPTEGSRLFQATVAGTGRGLRLLPVLPRSERERRREGRRALVLLRVYTDSPAGAVVTAPTPQLVPCPAGAGGRPAAPLGLPPTCLLCDTPLTPLPAAAGGGWIHPPGGWLETYPPLEAIPGVTALALGWRPLDRGRRRRPECGYQEILLAVQPRARLRLSGLASTGRWTRRVLCWTGRAWRDEPPR